MFKLRLIVLVLAPVAAYLLARRLFHSDLVALTVTAAIPIAWALAGGALQRRVDPVALGAAIVLGAALAIALAAGGGPLALKLRRAAVSGSLGVACLSSVIVRKPLLPMLLGMLGRSWPRSERFARAARGLQVREEMTALTAIIGVAALCDAAAQATLALSVSTTTFVATAGLVRLAVSALGLGVCAVYLRRATSRRLAANEDGGRGEPAALVAAAEPPS
jgi:hypothetical protein